MVQWNMVEGILSRKLGQVKDYKRIWLSFQDVKMDACLFIHAFSFIYEYSSNIFPTKKTKKKKIFLPQMKFLERVERMVLVGKMVPFMDI
jgi:hypothetical protein